MTVNVESLVGKWRPFDLDEYTTSVVIENGSQGLQIKSFDESDGEVYKVSNIDLIGESLNFEIYFPSTKKRVKHRWKQVTEYIVLADCTYLESWVKREGFPRSARNPDPSSSFGEIDVVEDKQGEWLVGRWEPDEEDYTCGPVVEIGKTEKGFQVREFAKPETRNEVYVVSNIEWDGNVLTFETGVPLNWRRKQRFKPVSKDKVINEVTVFSDPWKKILNEMSFTKKEK